MKWIGQHIYDFISRFRNDVYLEDISTGTIASGGNLGLDSNNKIVKADTETGELTIANASDNRIVTSLGGTDLNAEANLTFNGSVFAMSSLTATISDSSAGPILTIQNTGDNSYGGGLLLENTRGGNDASDSDSIGIISFVGRDDGVPSIQYYGDIVCTATDVTSDQEKGELKLRVASYDGVRTNGLLLAGTDTDNEVDVTIGAGAASLTTIAGTLTMGSTAFVNNSGRIQVATQSTIDHDSLANFVANEHIDWTGDVSASSVIHTNNITDLHGAGVNGSANQLLTDDGDGTVTSEAGLTYNADVLYLQDQTNGFKPELKLENRDSSATKCSLINVLKRKGAPGADGDVLGIIYFSGDNSLEQNTGFAQITAGVATALDTDEAGSFKISCATSNGTTSSLRDSITLTGHATGDYVDTTIGYGAASTTTIAGNLEIGGDDLTFQSATSNKPSLQLINTNTDAVAPELVFQKLANGADGDDLGSILFKGDDVAGNVETFAQILGEINESADGDEEGKLSLTVASHDGELQNGLTIYSGDAEDEVDVVIGNGAASLLDIAGDVRQSGTSYTTVGVLTIDTGAALNLDAGDGKIFFKNAGTTYAALTPSTGLHLDNIPIIFEGSTPDTNETTLTVTDPTADRTITLPDATGTVALNNISYHHITASFFDTLGTTAHYIPLGDSTSEVTSDLNTLTDWIAPCETTVDSIIMRMTNITATADITFTVQKDAVGSFSTSDVESETLSVTSTSEHDVLYFSFDSATIAKGETLKIKIQCASSMTSSTNHFVRVNLIMNWNDRYTGSSQIFTS